MRLSVTGSTKYWNMGGGRDNEEAELKNLLYMRQALLDPDWGRIQFISKKIQEK